MFKCFLKGKNIKFHHFHNNIKKGDIYSNKELKKKYHLIFLLMSSVIRQRGININGAVIHENHHTGLCAVRLADVLNKRIIYGHI